MSKDGLRVKVSIDITGIDGYTERTIHSASLFTTGPLDVPAAIAEAKALAQKCLNATREAAERSNPKVAAPKDPDEVPAF